MIGYIPANLPELHVLNALDRSLPLAELSWATGISPVPLTGILNGLCRTGKVDWPKWGGALALTLAR